MPDIVALIDRITIVENEDGLNKTLQKIYEESKIKSIRLAFVNAHAINMTYKDDQFYRDLMSCEYLFRDGVGMKILYGLLGKNVGLNLNGTDFIPKILDVCKGFEIVLFGTKNPYLQNASKSLAEKGLNPLASAEGFYEDEHYLKILEKNPANIVLLGMGMPKQERVARKLHVASSNPGIIICGGAILDFLGGKVRRAPKIFRQYGMEWVYRLFQEPRRLFSRYIIGNAIFLYRAFLLSLQRPAINKSSLKILHVVRQYHPAIGGLETYARSISLHQKSLGYDCTVLTLNRVFQGNMDALPKNEIIGGIKVRRVAFWGKRRYFLPLISPFYFRQFDIVHVHNTDVFYDYIALCSFIWRFPAFATTHGGFFHTHDFSFIKSVYFNFITRISSCAYKTIFATSDNDYKTFQKISQKVVIQYNAVEPLGSGLCEGEDFLYIGRLSSNKNIPDLLKTFSVLKNTYKVNGDLKIIGPAWDVSIEDLKELSTKFGIDGHVHFYGALSSDKIRETAQTCGFFVSASGYEGFGMSMIESMTVGLIPFVQKNDAFKELIDKSDCGICIDYKNPEQAAKDIVSFMPSINREMHEKAKNFSLHYSWPSLVKNTDSIYKDAIEHD